jgi:hypothetical protein
VICACGCNQPTRGNSAYASDACRARAWRERVGYGPQKRPEGRTNGKQRPSGRQLSYKRTVEWLTLYLVCTQGLDPQRARHKAELQLSALLPERQRAA